MNDYHLISEDLRHREEKYQRLQTEFRNTLESIAILLSLPTRFVEAHESTIKDRIREILSDNKDKSVVSRWVTEKVNKLEAIIINNLVINRIISISHF